MDLDLVPLTVLFFIRDHPDATTIQFLEDPRIMKRFAERNSERKATMMCLSNLCVRLKDIGLLDRTALHSKEIRNSYTYLLTDKGTKLLEDVASMAVVPQTKSVLNPSKISGDSSSPPNSVRNHSKISNNTPSNATQKPASATKVTNPSPPKIQSPIKPSNTLASSRPIPDITAQNIYLKYYYKIQKFVMVLLRITNLKPQHEKEVEDRSFELAKLIEQAIKNTSDENSLNKFILKTLKIVTPNKQQELEIKSKLIELTKMIDLIVKSIGK